MATSIKSYKKEYIGSGLISAGAAQPIFSIDISRIKVARITPFYYNTQAFTIAFKTSPVEDPAYSVSNTQVAAVALAGSATLRSPFFGNSIRNNNSPYLIVYVCSAEVMSASNLKLFIYSQDVDRSN